MKMTGYRTRDKQIF